MSDRNGGKGNEPPRREKTEKPEGCRKLFAGNLSYNIDDATIVDFFKECGELTGLRWLTRQGTEEFRVSFLISTAHSNIFWSHFGLKPLMRF